MNAKIFLLAFCLALAVCELSAQLSSKAGFCPLKHTVYKCTPSCVSDHQCGFNEKCCPNKCGNTSCVSPSAVSTGNDDRYGSNSGGAVYCEGRRCSPGEKCKMDRQTKRENCVRA